MRRRAFVHLAAFIIVSLAFGSSAFAADDIRVSGPIVHENLAVYLLHGSAADKAVPVTLQEALAKGSVRVDETGSVNELTVENLGSEEVFVQAGDIVKGGRQDRVPVGGSAAAARLGAGLDCGILRRTRPLVRPRR